jgi:very-short-patch-repair endonuclease
VKSLRRNLTDSERLLWKSLRAKQLSGSKFRRQEPIGPYIVDFVCYDKRLIVEVDGGQHRADEIQDRKRDDWLNQQGFKVLRFWNNEVLGNIDGVLERIAENLVPPPPTPPTRGGESQGVSSRRARREVKNELPPGAWHRKNSLSVCTMGMANTDYVAFEPPHVSMGKAHNLTE